MREAVVVAHPDDETLWGAGWIMRHQPDVICCSVPRRDPERAIRFFEAVRVLGGYPILLPFVESSPTDPLPHLDLLDLSRYDHVCTHGAKGEYGHVHHKGVHLHVAASFPGRMTTFGFKEGVDTIHLTKDEQQRKLEALRCYDNYSNADGGKPKWQALLDVYKIDMGEESYDQFRD